MIRRITKIFSLMTLVFFAISSASFAQNIINSLGTYKIVVNGFDWGPAVDRVIVTLDTKISEIDSKSISVVETKKWYTSNPSENFNRIITNSYLSDSKGNKVKGASNSFVLELKVSPSEETTDKPHTNKICTLFQIKKDRKYLMKFFYLFSFPEILDFFQN